MASSNIKLFDENKGNMLTDTEFNISTQRLNGLQTGVASSQLQNKAMYQASLVAYAIAQIMLQNGLNANDTDAVSAFVANLSNTMLQKVHDVATTEEAQAGVATGKWMSPALVKAAIDVLAAKAQNILSDATKALYGLGTDAVPDDVLMRLSALVSTDGLKIDIVQSSKDWITPKARNQEFFVLAVGGGGAGGESSGGGSGYIEESVLTIQKDTVVTIVCGAGGSVKDENGGTTSFGDYLSALGGRSGGNGGHGNAGGGSNWGRGGDGGKYGGGGGGGQNGAGGNGGKYGGGGGGLGGKGTSGSFCNVPVVPDNKRIDNLQFILFGKNGIDNGGITGGIAGYGSNGGNGFSGAGAFGGGGGGGYRGNGGNGGQWRGGGGGGYGGNGGNAESNGGGGGGGFACNGADGNSNGGGGGGGFFSDASGIVGGNGGVLIAYFEEETA